MPAGGYSASYSDAATSAATLNAGAKVSGLNIAAPQSTPNWLAARMGGDGGGNALPMLAVAVVAVAALLLLKR